ncbi:hypothetical protein DYO89_24520, partial [Salmonella enterica subsp. enterica serovar Havana]|nr:hypothetical protein [Salmonella enterica subsp. enterica serovar Havana]
QQSSYPVRDFCGESSLHFGPVTIMKCSEIMIYIHPIDSELVEKLSMIGISLAGPENTTPIKKPFLDVQRR